MALATAELVAFGSSYPLCPHLLGHEHSGIATLQNFLLYINMYIVAEAGFCDGVHPVPNNQPLLERGEESRIAHFACLHLCRPCRDDLRMYGRSEKTDGTRTDTDFFQPSPKI